MEKIYNFYNIALEKQNVNLIYDKEKKKYDSFIKIDSFFYNIETKLYLKGYQITNEDMIKILFNEIRNL